jgi:oxygen-independent coproporphyrinogen-3 oxidase
MTMSAVDTTRRLHWATIAPHVFTIQYPPSRDFFRQRYRVPHDPSLVSQLERTLIYVHIPFCEAKCHYCNFAVDVRRDARLHRTYTEALIRQIESITTLLPNDVRIPGIDIGGGTPTLLDVRLLEKVLVTLHPLLARAEVLHPLSIETTPRIASAEPDKLAMMRDHGVSRVSVGIQSTNDETLANVNRKAQTSIADAALQSLVGTGFWRTNVDLVFGLPGQTRAHFLEDLARVVAAGVDSITTYDCLYRGEGRVLPRKMSEFPSMDDYRAFYELAYTFLHEKGYHAPYGSLNYSRHAGETGTSPYFEGRLLRGLPYLGLGSYSSSLVGSRWWFAPYATSAFVSAIESGDMLPAVDAYDLPHAERMAKSVLAMLNFGMIHREHFELQFGVTLDAAFPYAIATAISEGWLEDNGLFLGVVSGRFAEMPKIRALFYSVEAMDWVERESKRLPIFRAAS